MNRIKRRIFNIINHDENGNLASKIFDLFMIALIIVNVVTIIADTFSAIPIVFKNVFRAVDIFSLAIFTVEYILRLWTADLLYPSSIKYKARLKYAFSFMSIVDLLSILPFYLPFIFPFDLRVLRMIRLLRLFRLFKINRYTDALRTVGNVIKKKAAPLISSFAVVFILMIIASVIMYNIECDAQPEVFQNAFSGIWWSIVTLTTVGYGDIYPVTVFGKILGAVIALLGIGLVAVPTGIISAGFIESVDNDKKENENLEELNEKLNKLEYKLDTILTKLESYDKENKKD
ncbi:MAG: ion transporter [Oscillospiraceae bacterium]|nr:ion transporter [Oscillospiraceae bacterium]